MTLEAPALPAATDVRLRPVPDSRPSGHRFGGSAEPADLRTSHPRQPTLLDVLQDLVEDPTGPPRPRGVVIRRDVLPGSVRPADGLPEPAGWVAVLGLAIAQAVLGTRPLSQLQSWLDVAVLADLRCSARQHLRRGPRPSARAAPPVSVSSVRTQCPTPTTVEATVHLRIGAGSVALGVRLEASGRRWLCTALAQPQVHRAATPISARRPSRDTA